MSDHRATPFDSDLTPGASEPPIFPVHFSVADKSLGRRPRGRKQVKAELLSWGQMAAGAETPPGFESRQAWLLKVQ